MKTWKINLCLAITMIAALMVLTPGRSSSAEKPMQESTVAAKIRRFAPTVLTADTARLSVSDRRALARIIAAAKYLDPLYRRQVWSGNDTLLMSLQADTTPHGRDLLHYFQINVGPWSRLDENEPFIAGVPPKPPQGSFYP